MHARIILSLLLVVSSVAQQHSQKPSSSTSSAVYDGMGETTMRVSTQNAEAQKLFNQARRHYTDKMSRLH